ncbi:MAG: response regulator [Bryobacterales bacterium]|jgi:CheY-like chemotaxis protein|nr:response regulator [Bryobacterales bacterium]
MVHEAMLTPRRGVSAEGRESRLARILVVDGDVASRLTLQTVLRAGGYWVEAAASASEAVGLLDDRRYDLVLSDLRLESPEAGLKVLAHARMQDYRPATALVTAHLDSEVPFLQDMVVETQGIASLLTQVADLIGLRAMRRVERLRRQATA